MDALKDILELPQRVELSPPPESTTTPPCDLTKIQATIRAGRSKKAAGAMNIPQRYFSKGLPAGKVAQEALRVLRAGQSLFLTGSCGSGKTHLAVALMNNWFADGMVEGEDGAYQSRGRAAFLPAVELFLEIKQTFGKDDASEKAILDRYSDIPLLVLDDLGAEKVSDWSRTVLYLIIDRRYRACRQTIITSNLSHGELAEKLDDRLASRISEAGVILDLGETDHRLRRKL